MCVIFGADITNGHSVSVQMDGERDILTFKGYSNIYIQHVSKSAASTELTGQIKGVGEIPIPLLHSISVSFEIYGYPTISPIGRIKVTVSYLHCGIVKGVKSIYILESKVNPKVVKCNFRKSNPNNFGLNQGIISDVN